MPAGNQANTVPLHSAELSHPTAGPVEPGHPGVASGAPIGGAPSTVQEAGRTQKTHAERNLPRGDLQGGLVSCVCMSARVHACMCGGVSVGGRAGEGGGTEARCAFSWAEDKFWTLASIAASA